MNRKTKRFKILMLLRKHRLTRHQISAMTGIALESVCGRVNELLETNKVEVCGYVHCKETGQDREVLRART